MPEEDQERFKDYLELERYIEKLRSGHAAHPPADVTPENAHIYRMAALFRSAAPEASKPSTAFAEKLRTQLEEELQQHAKTKTWRFLFFRKRPQKSPRLSRRTLLTGGAATAAALVAGAGIGIELENVARQGTQSIQPADQTVWNSTMVPADIATTWHFVTTLDNLGTQAVRFTTDTLVGYIIRNDGDDDNDVGKENNIIALSASCTHMGCIVQWQDSDRRYHCPCHGGLFSEYGQVDATSPVRYVTPLPRLETKVENGNVYVKVPTGANSTPDAPGKYSASSQ